MFLSFKSKGIAIKYFSDMLKKYNAGDILDYEDFKKVMEILEVHPSYEEKISGGVKNILILYDKYGHKGFNIEQDNGNILNFSFYRCINGALKKKELFIQAARHSIMNDIITFKKTYFSENKDTENKVICPISKDLVGWYECHVDHEHPKFHEIVSMFIEQKNIDLDKVEYENIVNGQGNTFSDKRFESEFVDFHNDVAKLRILKAETNIKLK